MTLNGQLLSSWQRGRRRFAIEQTHRVRKWRPTSLLSSCLRAAIIQLSSGADPNTVSDFAVNRFMSYANTPGLLVLEGTDTYTLAMDLCATIRTIIEYLSRLTLLTITLKPPIRISNTDNLSWSFQSHVDESSVLHRWSFVDHINPDLIYKELHSWPVIGDITASSSPMQLHLINIGRTEGSRRASPWCRAYKSPTIHGLFRFRKRSGNGLVGDWKPIYFADNPKSSAQDWVDVMVDDANLPEDLIQHIHVKEPSETHASNFFRDLRYEHQQIVESISLLHDPFSLPMCRNNCDAPYPCPYQDVCYHVEPNIKLLDTLGPYERISTNSSSSDGTGLYRQGALTDVHGC